MVGIIKYNELILENEKMAIVAERTSELMHAFLNGEVLSIDDIKNIIHAKSKQSVYNYLEECRNSGLDLVSYREKRIVYYKLDNYEENVFIEPMTKDAYECYMIIELLYNCSAFDEERGKNLEYIYNHLTGEYLQKIKKDQKYRCSKETLDLQINSKRTKFYELVNKLLEEGLIYRSGNKKNSVYYLSEINSIKVMNTVFNENYINSWYSIYDLIREIPSNYKYYKQLEQIQNKLALLLGETDELTNDGLYLIYGRAYHGAENFSEEYKKIAPYAYKEKVLKIYEKSNNKKNSSTNNSYYIGVVRIIYSLAQDKLYIYGESIQNPYGKGPKKRITNKLIDISKIESIEETNVDNTSYCNKKYVHNIDRMIGASEDREDSIRFVVSGKCNESIKFKLECLANTASAAFRKENDNYIFEGSLIGRGNLLKILRGLGDDLIDIQEFSDSDGSENKDWLFYRKEMINSAQKTINSYEEIKNYEKAIRSN